jgi:branched-chain amino acid transport system permease protein
LAAENWTSNPAPAIKRQRNIIIQLALLVIFLLLPILISSQYHLTLLITIFIFISLSMTFVLQLRLGLISMGIAAFWGFGAYSSAMMVTQGHMNFWLSLPLAMILTAVLAFVLGLILVRNPGFGFTIMTMILNLLFVVAVGGTKWLGGYTGIVNIPAPNPIPLPFLPPLEFTSNLQFYYLALVLVVLVTIAISALYASSIGRSWTAIGLNGRLAQSLGIDLYKYRLTSFIIAGAIAGLIGGFYGAYIGCLQPDTFNMFKTITMHINAILGGTIFPLTGPAVGTTIYTLFPELMRVAREWEPIITGFLLIILVIFLPGGLLSLPGFKSFATDPIKSVSGLVERIKSRGSKQGAKV